MGAEMKNPIAKSSQLTMDRKPVDMLPATKPTRDDTPNSIRSIHRPDDGRRLY
jgi:hypothetical protein